MVSEEDHIIEEDLSEEVIDKAEHEIKKFDASEQYETPETENTIENMLHDKEEKEPEHRERIMHKPKIP